MRARAAGRSRQEGRLRPQAVQEGAAGSGRRAREDRRARRGELPCHRAAAGDRRVLPRPAGGRIGGQRVVPDPGDPQHAQAVAAGAAQLRRRRAGERPEEGRGARPRARSRHRGRRGADPRSGEPARERLHAVLSRAAGARARAPARQHQGAGPRRSGVAALEDGRAAVGHGRHRGACQADRAPAPGRPGRTRRRWCWSARASRSTAAAFR